MTVSKSSVHNPANKRVAADGIKSLVVIQRSLAAAQPEVMQQDVRVR